MIAVLHPPRDSLYCCGLEMGRPNKKKAVGNDQFPTAKIKTSVMSVGTSNSEVKSNPEIIRQALHDFYGACPPDLWMYVWVPDDRKSHWFQTRDLDEAAAFTATVEGSCYWPASLSKENLGPKHRCANEQSAGILGLWTDIDIKGPAHKKKSLPTTMEAACELAESLGLFPTYHVATGHGLQPYWLFKKPWIFKDDKDRASAARLVARWHGALGRNALAAGWELDATQDLARILRVPGTVNVKPDCDRVPVEFLNEDGRRYTVEELAALVEPEEEAAEELKNDARSSNFSSVLRLTVTSGLSPVERCRRYVGKMPGGVSGQNGHRTTFGVSQVIFRGFALSREDGRPILVEYNQRCDPAWSEKDLEHKIDDAIHKSRLPMGYLLNKSSSSNGHSAAPATREDPAVDLDMLAAAVLTKMVEKPEYARAIGRIIRAAESGGDLCV
jgi:hypothetical protein